MVEYLIAEATEIAGDEAVLAHQHSYHYSHGPAERERAVITVDDMKRSISGDTEMLMLVTNLLNHTYVSIHMQKITLTAPPSSTHDPGNMLSTQH